ncbi:PEP-CTERM sorting domain-containing protein [Gemmatimonas sp.]|uniref:PEP-CTERM sorting domain-containing protein n=1 Tax=Gemmatimonas sp. TaxID=1962908 RepID=UPI003983748B
MKKMLFTAAMIAVAASTVGAQEAMPSFSGIVTSSTQASGVWYTDRFAPSSFATIGSFQGRTDVLQIGISNADGLANRPTPFQSMFYNTQGRKFDIGATGPFTLSADLWVDESWRSADNGLRRTDMWGTAFDNANQVAAYPITGFTNVGGTGMFRGYDVNTGLFINFNAPVLYGAWNSFRVAFDGTSFSYLVNGVFQASVGAGNTAGLGNVIMQAYNFDDSFSGFDAQKNNYNARWSNTTTVPEPSTYVLMAAGLAGLVAVQRRRRRA